MLSTTEIENRAGTLFAVARSALEHGLAHDQAPRLRNTHYPNSLQQQAACFVTLRLDQALRGCIGNLNVHQPLVNEVSDNAFASGFRDPRFAAISADELALLHIDISVLTPQTPVEFGSEAALLATLRPGEDGIVLEAGARRSTFLPSVWDDLPEPLEFMRQLKLKAGLPGDYWSEDVRIYRYGTVSISE